MQRPHESVFENNPAFADLYPRLEARIEQLLNRESDEAQRLHLEQLTQSWTKLKIMWQEMQSVLGDPQYKELSNSLSHYISLTRFSDKYEQDLEALKVPATHTFIQTPTNLQEQLQILSDVLASNLSQKLSLFRKFQALAEHDDDLAAEKTFRDAQMREYLAVNEALRRQLSQNITVLFKTATILMGNQADYLEKVKHGSAEKFTASYLDYYEAVIKALLAKAQQALNDLVTSTYTLDMRRRLEMHARKVKQELPLVQARLQQVNAEIARREGTKTPEYVAAMSEYQSLKAQIAQAEQDIDKLSHYRAPT